MSNIFFRSDHHQHHNLSPRSEGDEAKISHGRTSKDYPKPWTTNAKPPIGEGKQGDRGVNQSDNSSQDDGNYERYAREHRTATRSNSILSPNQQSHKPSERHDTGLDDIPEKNETPRKMMSYARREKLRMQRIKVQILAKINRQGDSQEDLDQPNRRYSNTDAANIYYASIVNNIPPVSQNRIKLPAKDTSFNETDNRDLDNKTGAATANENDGFKRKPKEYVLNKRETDMYLKLRSVYGGEVDKSKNVRQQMFYKKIEQVQLEKWKLEHEEYKKRKQRERMSKERQIRQLKRVRERFEVEQARRFRNQFVTGKILEHEWQTSQVYGLPDEVHTDPQYAVKLKSKTKKPKPQFDRRKKFEVNKKKYKKLFQVNRGPSWDPRCKTPKMEGIDTIVLEETDGEGNVLFNCYFYLVVARSGTPWVWTACKPANIFIRSISERTDPQ